MRKRLPCLKSGVYADGGNIWEGDEKKGDQLSKDGSNKNKKAAGVDMLVHSSYSKARPFDATNPNVLKHFRPFPCFLFPVFLAIYKTGSSSLSSFFHHRLFFLVHLLQHIHSSSTHPFYPTHFHSLLVKQSPNRTHPHT